MKIPTHQKKTEIAKDLLKIIERGTAKANTQLFKTIGGTPSSEPRKLKRTKRHASSTEIQMVPLTPSFLGPKMRFVKNRKFTKIFKMR
jgi:hypothetical protein